jgi:hypothetical protein
MALPACSSSSNEPDGGPSSTSKDSGGAADGPLRADGSSSHASDASSSSDGLGSPLATSLDGGSDATNDAGDSGGSSACLPATASAPLTGAAAVSVGYNIACAVTTGGGVACWGDNNAGELGAGVSGQSNSAPVPIIGLQSGVVAVSAGAGAACALTAGGGVECWGDNPPSMLYGAPNSVVPVPVAGLTSGVTAVSVGGASACALAAGGAVECWGTNSLGELGNGADTGSSLVPVPVAGLTSGVTAVSVGNGFACALTAGGGVECWGANSFGELGNDTDGGSSLVPVPVAGLASGVTAVSVGGTTACALTAGGAVECWGDNAYGALGNDSDAGSSPVPVPVTGLASGVTAVSVGQGYACALTAGAAVECWGYDGYTTSLVPVPVTGLASGVTAVSVGAGTACALTAGGAVECWGANAAQNPLPVVTPIRVPTIDPNAIMCTPGFGGANNVCTSSTSNLFITADLSVYGDPGPTTTWNYAHNAVCIDGTLSPTSCGNTYGVGLQLQFASTQVTGSGLTVTLSNFPPFGAQAILVPGLYCAELTGTTNTIPWASFNTKCYDTPPDGTALDGGAPAISQVKIQAQSGPTAASFNFCVDNIAVAPPP